MARRPLLALTLAVLAVHALALRLLPARGTRGAQAPPMAMHTRLLPPDPPALAQAPRPRHAAAKRPRRTAKPAAPAVPAAAIAAPAPDAPTPHAPAPDAPTPDAQTPADAAAPGVQASQAPPQEPPARADFEDEVSATADAQALAPPEPAPVLAPASAVHVQFPDGRLAHGPLPAALAPPARLGFDAQGRVKGFDYHARAELLWQHDGAHYQARQTISAFLLGARTQSSQGSVGAHGLIPERFDDQARRLRSATLDFARGLALFSRPDTPPAAIAPGAQDRLSVFLQLAALLAAADHYPENTRFTIDTVGATDVEPWTFVVRGAHTLDLPIGQTPTLHLERLPRSGRQQTAELWLGTQIAYLPARIRLSEPNGDVVELSLRSRESP